jgi:hypothetical protein
MADDAIVLNGNEVTFVEEEGQPTTDTEEIYPGNLVVFDANGDVTKNGGEAATGHGQVLDLPFDPDVDKGDNLNGEYAGNRASVKSIPIGGEVDLRLAAGGDLTTAANANVTQGDLLVESANGGLAAFASAETSGTPEGAVYEALESVDNSGAAAGVGNQVYIEVRRIA